MNSISKTLPLLLMLALLTACKTTSGTATTGKAICALWGELTYSGSEDSQQTVAEVRALNAKRDAYCK